MLKGSKLVFLTKLFFLSRKSGYCYAKNRAFVDDPELGVDERTIQRWISFLKNSGMIEVNIVNNNDRRIFLTNSGLACLPTRVLQSHPGQNATPDNEYGHPRNLVTPGPAESSDKVRQFVTPGTVHKHTNSTEYVLQRCREKLSDSGYEQVCRYLEGEGEAPKHIKAFVDQIKEVG